MKKTILQYYIFGVGFLWTLWVMYKATNGHILFMLFAFFSGLIFFGFIHFKNSPKAITLLSYFLLLLFLIFIGVLIYFYH